MISQHLEMSKDKTGWEIGIRILSIMCHIEMGNDDHAATQIKNLELHIWRSKSEGEEISERDAKIVCLLKDLSQNGFQSNNLKDKTMKIFVDISGNDKKLKWEPLGHELIRFDTWLGGKLGLKVKKFMSARKLESKVEN